jgi:hypothetical protein
MLARLTPLLPLKVLAARAGVGYVLLRALLVAVTALLAEFAGREAAASLSSPLGVVLISAAVGYADVRRRGELLFWANLGFPSAVPASIFALAAILGESLLYVLLA